MPNELDEILEGLALMNKVSVEELKEKVEAFRTSPDDDFEELLIKYFEDFSKAHPEELQQLMSGATNERSDYSIVKNGDGDMILIIHAHDDEPENARFIYDGTDCVLLYRSMVSTQLLKGVTEETIDALRDKEEITVVEELNGEIGRQYKAEVRKVKDVRELII